LNHTNVKTLPYPGFPTDMQPQICTVLSLAQGTSVVTESVWDNRYKYVNELRKMGAEIQVDGRVAVIEGGRELSGAVVQACDLRAGAAMVIAGLCAKGTTMIEDVHYIERGYENFVGKLRALGADISVVDFPDDDGGEKIISVS
jgi:UDP-N-acetylglucosamine 1-carboxyvinyltransferase